MLRNCDVVPMTVAVQHTAVFYCNGEQIITTDGFLVRIKQ